MYDYLSLLSGWMNEPKYMLLVLVSLYLILAGLDMLLGMINAKYSDKVEYRSKAAQLGGLRKIGTWLVMVLVAPIALMFPMDIAVYSLMILYLGIVVSELYSILGHLGLVKDNDKHKYVVGELFTNFLQRILSQANTKNKDKD